MSESLKEGVSIIICSYNGVNKLKPTLNAIGKLKADFPWELIVVDNASKDATFDISRNFLKDTLIDFRVEKCETPGKMFAFWKGISLAKYEYILDCDDDNHLRDDYLTNGFHILESNERIGALGGCGIPVMIGDQPDWFQYFEKSYAIGPQAKQPGKLQVNNYLYGAGSFFRKDLLLKLRNKGFSSMLSCRKGDQLTSGGDTELCMAILLLGNEIWYSDQLIFGHELTPARLTWSYFLKMKEGGASSFPLLLAYRFREFDTEIKFRWFLWRMLYVAWKGFIKTSFQMIWSSERNIQVAHTVCKAKIRAYSKNLPATMSSYKLLKENFHSCV